MNVIGMEEQELRRIFQRIKSMTNKQFYEEMDYLLTDAYNLGQKHMTQAMQMHPRIYNPMIKEVQEKAAMIREEWEGIREVQSGGVA